MKKFTRNFVWMITLIFLVLRCTGIIKWSFWTVFSPVFIYYGILPLTILSFIVFFIMFSIYTKLIL